MGQIALPKAEGSSRLMASGEWRKDKLHREGRGGKKKLCRQERKGRGRNLLKEPRPKNAKTTPRGIQAVPAVNQPAACLRQKIDDNRPNGLFS